jgi:diguanylate cyclase (GGDEF)-like protein/PAS domain S-box-containing protein
MGTERDSETRDTERVIPSLTREIQELKERERHYRSLFEGIPLGLYQTTPGGKIVDANPELVRMLKYPDKETLLGTQASDHFADPSDRREELNRLHIQGVVQRYETKMRTLDGDLIFVRDTCRAVYGPYGDVLAYHGSLENITEEKALEEQLLYMARHDPLTGVYNRHALRELLDSEMARARRYGHPIGLLMVDVNRFKELNDRFGHSAGDAALQAVADVLAASTREADVVIRYGGDEFLVMLPETDGESEIVRGRILQQMAHRFAERPLFGFPVTLAVGTAHWNPRSDESIESVLGRADRAMYEDKRRSRANDE